MNMERFEQNSRLLRKINGKLVEINPDGSHKEDVTKEVKAAVPEPNTQELQKKDAAKVETRISKAGTSRIGKAPVEGRRYHAPIWKLPTATKFHKSGKEAISVPNESSKKARDEGGPHILESKRTLSRLEQIREETQADKSERSGRGGVRSFIFNYETGEQEIPKKRTRGRTSRKTSWKLNRLHQRRGSNQSRWER